MVRKCIVPLCSDTYDKKFYENKEKGAKCPSTFTCPSEELLPEWKRRIPRKNYNLTMKSPVCARHFHEEDIEYSNKFTMPDGSVCEVQKAKPTLKANAVPKIFDGPKYLSVQVPKKRVSQERKPLEPKNLNERVPSPPPPRQALPGPAPEVPGSPPPPHEPGPAEPVTPQQSPPTVPSLTVEEIHNDPHKFKLPGKFWGVHTDRENETAFSMLHPSVDLKTNKIVLFKDSLVPRIILRQVDYPMEAEVISKDSLERLLLKVDKMRLCSGVSEEGSRQEKYSTKCTVQLNSLRALRCMHCRAYMKNVRRQKKSDRVSKLKIKVKQSHQKGRRWKKRAKTATQLLKQSKREMRAVSEATIAEIIQQLPEEQRELVSTCFKAANQSRKGMRYTRQYVYDCLLIKMMSSKLYRKLRQENKLPLPCEVTLNRYLKRISPSYGFQQSTFKMLEKKQEHMTEAQRHGALLLDEMAIDDLVSFDPVNKKTFGLVDLDKFTEPEDKGKRGDHGLVLMYQPFQGQWVQAIAAFLSAGATRGRTLKHIILEAVLLLENSGFHVDCITTDGASWNRTMWDLFGVSKETSSFEHPCDSQRELYFASDFPHLVKNMWARIVNKKILNLPEGQVKLSHWKAVVDADKNKGVRRAFTLSEDHLDPTSYQKMSVPMAMRFFGHTARTAMQAYMDEGLPGLEDAGPTIEFITRINDLVEAMNSQVPEQGLRPNPNSKYHKILLDFLEYLDEMEEMSKKRHTAQEKAKQAMKKPKRKVLKTKQVDDVHSEACLNAQSQKVYTGGAPFELTTSTFFGLLVTVRTALGLIKYLSSSLQYKYLLTRRLNQDALEHFFGMIRSNCGSSNHPDPKLFIQVYRVLTAYSLLKPPRGSNVTGAEMLTTLLNLTDLEEGNESRKELEDKLDVILDGDIVVFDDDDEEFVNRDDHAYIQKPVDEEALTVLGGYVSRKMRKLKAVSECKLCFNSLCKPEGEEQQNRERLLDLRSYGGYLKPSNQVYELMYKLEEAFIHVSQSSSLHSTTFFDILDALICAPAAIKNIGCEEHRRRLTGTIISFYLTCRMHFACRQANEAVSNIKRKKRNMAKLAKQTRANQD